MRNLILTTLVVINFILFYVVFDMINSLSSSRKSDDTQFYTVHINSKERGLFNIPAYPGNRLYMASVNEVTPLAKSYKIKVGILNPYSVSLSGIKLTLNDRHTEIVRNQLDAGMIAFVNFTAYDFTQDNLNDLKLKLYVDNFIYSEKRQ